MPIRGRGRGLPDWSREVKYPTLLPPKQKEWSVLLEFKKTDETDNRIPPFSIASTKVYTVEEGYRLLLKGAMCSMTDEHNMPLNVWCEVWLVISTPGFLGRRYFLITDALTFVPSQEVKEKHSLYIYLHNYSGEYVSATVNLIGVLESLREEVTA